jgi:thioredoxin-like negative regulator of GroEL
MHWTHVWDPNLQAAKRFGIRAYPTMVLIDHEGGPVSLWRGFSPREEMRLSAAVKGRLKVLGKAQRASR